MKILNELVPVEVLTNKNQFDQQLQDIETILFDFDGTLVDYYDNEKQALGKILEAQDVQIQKFDEIILDYRSINQKLWEQYERNEVTVDQVRVKRFAILSEKYGINLHPEEFNRQYVNNFSTYVRPYPGIIKSLEAFKEKHPYIKLVILTNGIESTQIQRRQNSGLHTVTDALISSDRAGVAKPAPEIFDYVQKELNVDLSKSVMIGDSLTSDIQGASNIGIPNVYIEHDMSNKSKEDYNNLLPKPNMVTESTIEFLDYLSQLILNSDK